MKKAAGILLLILGIYLLYLGLPAEMQPPIVSGIGFMIIGIVWLLPAKK